MVVVEFCAYMYERVLLSSVMGVVEFCNGCC